MPRYAPDITRLIGRTPMLELRHLSAAGGGRLFAKLECMNPSHSGKDRPALAMIESAERAGRLQPGGTVIEPTGGNTGIALAMVAAARGYHLILTMPEGLGSERIPVLQAYGAEVIETPAEQGMRGAIAEAERLANRHPGALILQQFGNRANPQVHRDTTAWEIWEDLDGQVDALVAGVGTGGTLTGCAERLKELRPGLVALAVEPAASPVLSGGAPGPHTLAGIGCGFVPDVLDLSLIDEVIAVTDAEARSAMRRLARVEALLVGLSSGAVCHAAETVAQRAEMRGKNLVLVLHDHGERYTR